jgi:hypothetical protein
MEKLAIKKVVLEPKDRLYILKNNSSPLAYYIASKDTPRKRLLFYDEVTNTNHPLRYARNSNSPFQEEQDQNVIVEPIVFEDGTLNVPKNKSSITAILTLPSR